MDYSPFEEYRRRVVEVIERDCAIIEVAGDDGWYGVEMRDGVECSRHGPFLVSSVVKPWVALAILERDYDS